MNTLQTIKRIFLNPASFQYHISNKSKLMMDDFLSLKPKTMAIPKDTEKFIWSRNFK